MDGTAEAVTTEWLTCEWCGDRFPKDPRPQTIPRRWCKGRCRQAAWREASKLVFTGKCAVCEKPVVYPHKLCSRKCRSESQKHGGRTMGTYNCAFCGREVTRVDNDARRQQHCSQVCANRNTGPDIVLPEIDPDFGYWLAGLTDGEGCFTLSSLGGTKSVHANFAIKLRHDDAAIVEKIRNTLGFGRFSHVNPKGTRKDGTPNHPQTGVYFSNTKECLAIKELFERFPLRSKKARDFAIWSEALSLMKAGEIRPEPYRELAKRIREIRKYVDPDAK